MNPELQDGQVEVTEAGAGPYATSIRAGTHLLTADEPASLGGGDKGPGPYDYLLAALGACTSITLRMFADRKKIPLTKVSVRLSQKKIHAADCADCENKAGQITEIERVIRLEGELSDEQRRLLLDIADKCPVHRTLTSEIKIRTRAGDWR
jgi:putative redox protein